MDMLKCEWLKIKIWHLELWAIVLPLISVIFSSKITENIAKNGNGIKKIVYLFTFSNNIFLIQMLPLFILFILAIYAGIERATGGWNLQKMLQVNINSLLGLKFLITVGMVILCYVSYYIILAGFSISYNEVSLLKDLLIILFYSLICVLPIVAAFFVLFMCIPSIILNSSIMIIMMGSNFLIIQTKYWVYMPQTYYFMISQCNPLQRYLCLAINVLLTAVILFIGLKLLKSAVQEFKE